ncbi:MAG: 3-ketoacyl-ACP reductase [Pseudonocardiales bacterium]|nr:3-ketoacyl-ACP reductase [Pseudonocardiales bacterium]
MGKLDGKVAFITGAGRGQGRSHCLRLAEEGADIIAVDICEPIRGVEYLATTPEDLEETVRLVEKEDRRIHAAHADVRNLEQLKAIVAEGVAKFGGLDIVVANAGITILKPWYAVTEEIWDDTIAINTKGVWATVMASAEHLVNRGGGSIIMTSSTAGLKALPFLVPYVASKHAVTGLARAFAEELGRHNIRVNSVAPTGTNTPMSMHSSAAPEQRQSLEAALAENPKLGGAFGRMLEVESLEPRDISNAVLFLASDDSRYITGHALAVDAGNSVF